MKRYIFAGSQHHIRQFKRSCYGAMSSCGFDLSDYATNTPEAKNVARVDLYISVGSGPMTSAIRKMARARKKPHIHLVKVRWGELKNELKELDLLAPPQKLGGFWDEKAAQAPAPVNPVLNRESLAVAIEKEENQIAQDAAKDLQKVKTKSGRRKKQEVKPKNGAVFRAGNQVWSISGGSLGRPVVFDGVVYATGTDVNVVTEGAVSKSSVHDACVKRGGVLLDGRECRLAELIEATTIPGYWHDAKRDKANPMRKGRNKSKRSVVVVSRSPVEAAPSSVATAPAPPRRSPLVIVRSNALPVPAPAPQPAPTSQPSMGSVSALKTALLAAVAEDDYALAETLSALIKNRNA